MHSAERARPRAQQAPHVLTRWSSTDTPLALDAAAPEDGRAPLNRYGQRPSQRVVGLWLDERGFSVVNGLDTEVDFVSFRIHVQHGTDWREALVQTRCVRPSAGELHCLVVDHPGSAFLG